MSGYDSDYNIRPEAGRRRAPMYADSDEEGSTTLAPIAHVKHRPPAPRDSDDEYDAPSSSSRPPARAEPSSSSSAPLLQKPRGFSWSTKDYTSLGKPASPLPPPPPAKTKSGKSTKANFRVENYAHDPTLGGGAPPAPTAEGPYRSAFRADTGYVQTHSSRAQAAPDAKKRKASSKESSRSHPMPVSAAPGPSALPPPRMPEKNHAHRKPAPPPPSSSSTHRSSRRPEPLRERGEHVPSPTPSASGYGDGLFTPQSYTLPLSPPASSTRAPTPVDPYRHQHPLTYHEPAPTKSNSKGKMKAVQEEYEQEEYRYEDDGYQSQAPVPEMAYAPREHDRGRKLGHYSRDSSWDDQKPPLPPPPAPTHSRSKYEPPHRSPHRVPKSGPSPTPAPVAAPRLPPAPQKKPRQPSPTPPAPANNPVRAPAAQKLRTLTILIEDRRTGVDELAEVKVHLKPGEDPEGGTCFWTDAKDVCEQLQGGPSRIDGPAKVYTMRGKYRQTILRVASDGTETSQSAFLQVRKDKTLTVYVESIPEIPAYPPMSRSYTPLSSVQPLTPMSGPPMSLQGSPAPMHRDIDERSASPPKRKRAPTMLVHDEWSQHNAAAMDQSRTAKVERQHSPANSVIEISPPDYHSALAESPPKKARKEREKEKALYDQPRQPQSPSRARRRETPPPSTASPADGSRLPSEQPAGPSAREPPPPSPLPPPTDLPPAEPAKSDTDRMIEDYIRTLVVQLDGWADFLQHRDEIVMLSNHDTVGLYWFAYNAMYKHSQETVPPDVPHVGGLRTTLAHVCAVLGVSEEWFAVCKETLQYVTAYGQPGAEREDPRAVAAVNDTTPKSPGEGDDTDLLMYLHAIHDEHFGTPAPAEGEEAQGAGGEGEGGEGDAEVEVIEGPVAVEVAA